MLESKMSMMRIEEVLLSEFEKIQTQFYINVQTECTIQTQVQTLHKA